MWNLMTGRDGRPSQAVPRPAQARAFRRRFSVAVLRAALGVVFVWFGALKVAGTSPVAGLVADTVSWIPGLEPGWFVPLLGAFEVALGLGLLLGRGLRLLAPVLVAHLTAATALVLVTQPGTAFRQGNPMLLTTEGEFVIKNLVLVAAALVIGVRVQPRPVADASGGVTAATGSSHQHSRRVSEPRFAREERTER